MSEAVTNAVVHAYPTEPGQVMMTFSRQGQTLTIDIADKGVGIADVAAARVPMATSKPGTERAGLGFTVMEAFMDDLVVESEPGCGTCVRMTKTIGKTRGAE